MARNGSNDTPRRRGTVYLVVLVTVMIVTLISLAGLAARSAVRERSERFDDVGVARRLARSAIEAGLHMIDSDASWETSRGVGPWFADLDVASDPELGQISLSATRTSVDAGMLWTLSGIGQAGAARRLLAVDVLRGPAPMDALQIAAYADNDVEAHSATITGSVIVGATDDFRADASTIDVDVEAGSTISGSTYFGTQQAGSPVRDVPGGSALLSAYGPLATRIDVGDIPESVGIRMINSAAIGPGRNPYGSGSTNADGIYYIDCGGDNIMIINSRIRGTLILENPGTCIVANSVDIAPARPGYPSLIVLGTVNLAMSDTALDESTLGRNLNPAGVPNAAGVVDNDLGDVYPSRLEGIVFAEGHVEVVAGTRATVVGNLIAGDRIIVHTGAVLDLTYGSDAYDAPPPGFTDGTTRTQVRDWRRTWE